MSRNHIHWSAHILYLEHVIPAFKAGARNPDTYAICAAREHAVRVEKGIMNWKVIPALISITFLNIAVSCVDDIVASSNIEKNAAAVCGGTVKFDSLSREALQEIFLGGEADLDKDGVIILDILENEEVHAFSPGESMGKGPR
jgi:hypothetical protein